MNEQASDRYCRLPQELLQTPQWCIAGPDKAPYVASAQGVVHASLHRREQWRDFPTTVRDMQATGAPYCGFMLTYEDPWTCIDLDVCNAETQRLKGQPNDPSKWTSAETIQGFADIVRRFDSYTEVSTLGWGLHIWVRGRIGAGAKRAGVEVYSQERFIICTGDVYVNKPIEDRQALLDELVAQMRGPGYDGPVALVEVEEEFNDMEIFERAINAGNKEKFDMLCQGKWSGDYPSQSEADLALMSMFCFYSKSNEQCRRLFRCTELGRREKAIKNDRYLNYTLEVIRGRQAREAVIDASGRAMAEEYARSLQGTSYADVAAAKLASNDIPAETEGSIAWPPGVAGALAAFIYNSSPRPVKEVSIVAALGFLAGVCGKAFNIPQSGLNAYIILVARSGVGKEAMHSGLSLVCEELRQTIPMAQRFVDFNDFASGPALQKACATNTSFVNVSGEWGRKLKRIADDSRADGPMASLRTQMTNLYQKSGQGAMTGGITYSNKDQNIGSVTGVAYSMIGETTPGTFYESLTPSMMEDGFLSRFIIIEYGGDRPELNNQAERKMSEPLAQALQGLCAQALTNINKYHSEMVQQDENAFALLTAFDKECDKQINSSADESVRQMWNRAHLKVMRVAALLATADNWIQPIIAQHHAEWALELIRRDIKIMSAKLQAGEIGNDDEARERKMIDVLRKFLAAGAGSAAYGVPESLHTVSIVPKRYLQIRLSRSAQFLNTREGSTRSLDNTIRQMIENGYLQEMEKAHMAEKHSYHGRAFRILSLPK